MKIKENLEQTNMDNKQENAILKENFDEDDEE